MATIAVGGLSAFVAGCGAKAYETRMEETIEDLELQNKFVLLQPNETIVNAPESKLAKLSLRLPVIMPASRTAAPTLLTEGCAMPEDQNQPMPDARLKPPVPLPDIPGFQVSMEKFIPTGAGNRPCYMFVGLTKVTPNEAAAARQQVLEQLKTRLASTTEPNPAQNVAWQPESILTPKAGAPALPYQKLEVECRQLFEVRGNQANEVPGVFQLLTLETAGHQIYLGWRLPSSAYDRQNFLDAARAAAGTVRIG
ncbi:MAG: hypothetical protein QM775_33930 [Pirellulales bacterium]